MPFVKIKPKLIARSSNIDQQITIGAYLSEGIGKPRQLTIRIPKHIIDTTGFIVKNRHTSLDMHEGVGDDTGFIMLFYSTERGTTAATQGYSKTSTDEMNNNHGFNISFRAERFQYYTPNEWPQAATPVNHIVDKDGSLIIEVPDWLKPDLLKMKQEGLLEEEIPTPEPLPVVKPEPKHEKEKPNLNRHKRRTLGAEVARLLK